jgi:hypothetical protein
MTKVELNKFALTMLRATKNDDTRYSYLCGSGVESFGFFLWNWCEAEGIERADEASAREFAESGEFGVAWLVPVEIENRIEGIALFTGHAGDAPEDEPFLEDVFSSSQDAKAYLRKSGVIAGDSP